MYGLYEAGILIATYDSLSACQAAATAMQYCMGL